MGNDKPTPPQRAQAAADALRQLNHTPPADLHVGDVYATLGALTDLAGRLPQAINLLQAALVQVRDSGRLTVDATTTARPWMVADTVLTELGAAVRAVEPLRDHINTAWTHLGPVGELVDEDEL